jgi:dTDP-4-amino-4,6-dideoxygalactose transaminase
MSEKREIPFGRPDITDVDREAVMRVLHGHILTHGPECKAFETEFAAYIGEGAHCVSVSSCMAALHMAYLYLGIGAGAEVIVPALTHVAAAHAIEWVGATPKFVDPDPKTCNLTAERIAAAIGPKTKAISLVHFVGIPCEMDPIVALAERHGLKIIEDCAIALGAHYKGRHVGLFGDAGTFSFYPAKHMTTGEGGMYLSRHRAAADAISRLRAFGVDRTHTERSVPGLYEVPSLGLNYRMSEMQAALGRTQTAKLPEIMRKRTQNFAVLKRELSAASTVRVLDAPNADCQNSHYCLVAVLEGRHASKRNALVAALNAAGVGTSVYYPQPVPRMKYYRDKYGYDESKYPVATTIADSSIALPVGQHLGPSDMEYVGRTFIKILEEHA